MKEPTLSLRWPRMANAESSGENSSPGAGIHCGCLTHQLCDLTQTRPPTANGALLCEAVSSTTPGGLEKASPVPKVKIKKLDLCILKCVSNKRELFSKVTFDFTRGDPYQMSLSVDTVSFTSLPFLLVPFLPGRINSQVNSAPVNLYY